MKEEFNLLTLFNCKIFISFGLIIFFNPILAEQLLTKSEILKKSNECLNDLQYQICIDLFLKMERFQIVESEQNSYKCQASILGLQTELIEAYYFKYSKKNQNLIMIPYVIKNC